MSGSELGAESELNEVPFGFAELFFSRTDVSGLIQFGNSVFQRIAGYSWDELYNAPHKIVRHPDTPRAVFWLLWSTLGRSQPVSAYVKNRAKDGRHYWVYAVATPVEGGYMSVRMRPSSPYFAVVKAEYASLVELERTEGLAPKDSAALLLERLRSHGFHDYGAFMAATFLAETAARDARLGRPHDVSAAGFETLRGNGADLLKNAEVVMSAYAQSENVPFNFRVLAAQLGQIGAALSVISSNYTTLSTEMRGLLDSFSSAARGLCLTIEESCILYCIARLQHEAFEAFEREHDCAYGDKSYEMSLLDRQHRDYAARAARAAQSLEGVARSAEGFRRTCLDMSRLAASLEVTRVMGKVECSRHADAGDRMAELLSDLEAFQKRVAAALSEIDRVNQRIFLSAKALNLSQRRAA